MAFVVDKVTLVLVFFSPKTVLSPANAPHSSAAGITGPFEAMVPKELEVILNVRFMMIFFHMELKIC